MELKQIKYFLSASETLSFAETAEQFDVSRQAVSSSIKALGKELSIPLFDRSHNRLTLTSEAEAFAVRCRQTLDLFDAIEERFSPLPSNPLILALDSFLLSSRTTIFESLHSYAQQESGCDVPFSQEQHSRVLHRVMRRQADVGIVRTMAQLPVEFECVVLRTARLACIVNTKLPLAQRETVTPADLDDVKLIVPSNFDQRYLPLALTSTGRRRTQVYSLEEKTVATNAIMAGYGVGITDYQKEPGLCYRNGVMRIPFESADYQVSDILFYRRDNPRRGQVEDFVAWFMENNCWYTWGIDHCE